MSKIYSYIKSSERESHNFSMFEHEKQNIPSVNDYATEVRKMKNQCFSPRNYDRRSHVLSSQASRSTNQSSELSG